ncbi:MAG: RNA polymerase-associated protein RapA [Pseudomonadales bacterium]
MTDFKTGQKWISNAEPELGMGRVLRMEHRQITLFFDLVDEERIYARSEAPLTRVKFNHGDEIKTLDGIILRINSVLEQDGMHIYYGDYMGTETIIPETELDPNVRFSKPQERLFTHQLDDNRWFNLRYYSLDRIAQLAEAGSRGFYGPRVSLIPHQLYIASEVANRFAPRVLLADEVGLGKTIEAGLIIHQQLQTGRARRVLVVVPPALTFQWFVEMIRRFNLQFTVMDEERCLQIAEDNAPEFEDDDNDLLLDNPFEAQQLVLCSLDLFTEHQKRLEEAMASKWDLVVVDEAHHLKWTPEETSDEYHVVEQLSKSSTGLLLLTATPEQLGRTGHFARLRLLDPHRYHDYDTFVAEEDAFSDIAEAVNLLLSGNTEEQASARTGIIKILGTTESRSDEQLVSSLLDRHGTGRVLFRNVRSSIKGFPKRIPITVPLSLPTIYQNSTAFYPETDFSSWTNSDTRVSWLAELLANSNDKHLVICAHQETAVSLDQYLKNNTVIRSTVFHEGMDLVARDRAANYFSETYKGAQVMICSEIGSEGRNFQFASHLVLFDLPLGADLLEQRIGRLDRIGQNNDVTIYIPYFEDSVTQDLVRWYHEALDLFSEPNPVGQSLFDDLFEEFTSSNDIDAFLDKAKILNQSRLDAVSKGRDRLLELNSHSPEKSAQIVKDITAGEGGPSLEAYMELSFDVFGLESEPMGNGVHGIKPTETMVRNQSISLETLGHFHYPELPEEGILISYDRDTALSREDVSFFTWENPMVQQAMDVVLSDVTGNSAMIVIKNPDLKAGTLLLEVLHVVHCVAPSEFMVDRFMPPLVFRSMITPDFKDIADSRPFEDFPGHLKIHSDALHKILDSQSVGLNNMLERAQKNVADELISLIDRGRNTMHTELDLEIERLEQLMKVNSNVRLEEIDFLKHRRELLSEAINNTSMRMDAIRVIVCA